jgi:hypothetical protein
MNRTILKLTTFIALIILPLAVGAQSTNTDAQRALDNPYLSPQDKAIYSPVRNILEANLASTSVNDLFRQYGDALTGYVQVKNKQWESDRISCAEDVHDFLYAYMKRGDGTTPSALWSKLLQSNFFQSRTDAWNDFDGDGLINGEFIFDAQQKKMVQTIPQGRDLDGDTKNGDKGDFDDHYGFGVPNVYSPLVKQFGRDKTVSEVMALLGLGLDGDNDNDSLTNNIDSELRVVADGSMPYMYFASYGDANFDHTVTGAKDIYQRIGYDANGLPKINTQTNAQARSEAAGGDIDKDGISDVNDINPAGNDTMFWPYQYGSPTITPNGGQYTVAESGFLLQISTDIRNIAANSRSFDAQSAYNSEEIKKILTDNCVRMADLQGIMGRLEFKELISDRMARDISRQQLDEQTNKITDSIKGGYDEDGDGEGDSPQITVNQTYDETAAATDELKNLLAAYDRTDNSNTKEALGKIILGLVGEENPIVNSPIVTQEQAQEFASLDQPNKDTLAKNTKPQGFLGRMVSYLGAVASPFSGGGDNTTSGDAAFDSAFFWETLLAINNPSYANNPNTAFMLVSDDVRRSIEKRVAQVKNEFIANQGFKSYRQCILKNEDGSCEEWATLPGSIAKERLTNQLNTETGRLENSSEITDLEPSN